MTAEIEERGYSRWERLALEKQQMSILGRLEGIADRFGQQDGIRRSPTEAVGACINGEADFAFQGYRALYQVLREAGNERALSHFPTRGRAAVFETIAAFVLPTMLSEGKFFLPPADTQDLWTDLYSNHRKTIEGRDGFTYSQKHSPDVVVFERDLAGNIGITQLIEATLGSAVDVSDLYGKVKRSAFALLRSRKRELGLFASDNALEMTYVVPSDEAVVQNIDRAIHGMSNIVSREESGDVIVGIEDEVAGHEGEKILVRVNRVVLPIDQRTITHIYADLVRQYRPFGDDRYPTIEELLLAAKYGVLDTVILPPGL